MKLTYCLFFVALFAVSACKKSENEANKPKGPLTSKATINNKTYPTILLGAQEWTSSNYEGDGGISGAKPEYGKYYTLSEALAINLSQGWRIPTVADYTQLAESQGIVVTSQSAYKQEAIKKLTSKTNWLNVQGTNESGFNAYPAGYSFSGSAPMAGDISEFWTMDGTTFSIQEGANKSLRLVFYDNSHSSLYRFNLRFVRNR